MIYITIRIFSDAIPSDFDQILAFPKSESLIWTYLHTSGKLALNNPWVTHGTLPDSRS